VQLSALALHYWPDRFPSRKEPGKFWKVLEEGKYDWSRTSKHAGGEVQEEQILCHSEGRMDDYGR